jgi:ubiquitin-conjugating enzyme E2 J2
LTFHYVLEGAQGTPYEGGFYHGLLRFPSEYPFKPPSVLMITPNGRFEVNQRLCFSMSDYHPESWNPVWSHDKILIGLLSFMSETASTAGSINTSDDTKRDLATSSLAFNCKNEHFCKLFPELVELHQTRLAAALHAAAGAAAGGGGGGGGAAAAGASGGGAEASGAGAGQAGGGGKWSSAFYLLAGGLFAAWLVMHLLQGQGTATLEF